MDKTTLVETKLKEAVTEAIVVYNKYRRHEVEAKLIDLKKDHMTLEFRGPFCRTCGVYDYFDDFVYELEDVAKFRIKVDKVEESGPESFRVRYRIERE